MKKAGKPYAVADKGQARVHDRVYDHNKAAMSSGCSAVVNDSGGQNSLQYGWPVLSQ